MLNSAAYEHDSMVILEYHRHLPYTSTTLNNNDEIRLPSNRIGCTSPCECYLCIKFEYTNSADYCHPTLSLITKAFLFDEIRYEISGSEIECVENVGIKTKMKNLLTINPYEVYNLVGTAWYTKLALPSKDITF